MKRKGLFLLIALALGGATVAHAQDADNSMSSAQDTTMSATDSMSPTDYDGRWYIAPTIGGYYNDDARNTNSRQLYYGLGFGRFIAPNTSIDLFVDRTERDTDYPGPRPGHGYGKWSNNNYGVAARFYAGGWNAWRPYALVGVMGSYHMVLGDHGWSPAAELGVGLSKTISANSDFRVEAGYRYDWDDKSQPNTSGYGDWFLGLSLVSRFGAPPVAPAPVVAPPPPAQPTCDQLDDDGDNVNNCDDKCPGTASGTIVGPDGCPQKVVIDLRGVNFKFDRPSKGETDIGPTLQEPTADSMAILDQAVDTLQRYPQVHVTVAGYTDSIGTDAYNQGLSERRATIVYNYLTSHGIDASRLEGPIGHGENNPIDTNDTKEGRARNRRTELQVDQAAQQ
jgi:OOP family OmpA-OmpF porin